MVRLSRPGAALVAALAGVLSLALPAAAEPDAVGGPALASRGVVVAPGTPPPPPKLTASAWLVADLRTGDVLAARDPHGRYAPASTLKTLTALALLPRLPDSVRVVASRADVDVDGSKVGLVPGTAYPVDELFRAMLMVSGNDAANALASGAGGRARAVTLMNEEAARLGAADTVARNPSGLDAPGQVSSAYDLALVARAGMAMPQFATHVATMRSSMTAPGGGRFEILNHNKLLTRSYPGALGIKNGYTLRAGGSFVGAAERDGRTLVVTLLKATPAVWQEAATLLDWGFRAGAVTPVGRLVEPRAAGTTPTAEKIARDAAAGGAEVSGVPPGRPDSAADPAVHLAASSAGEPLPLVSQLLRTVLVLVLVVLATVVPLRLRVLRRRRRSAHQRPRGARPTRPPAAHRSTPAPDEPPVRPVRSRSALAAVESWTRKTGDG